MNSSLFRIDKYSVISNGDREAVELPSLEEMLDKARYAELPADVDDEEELSPEQLELMAIREEIEAAKSELEKVQVEAIQIVEQAKKEGEQIKFEARQEGYRVAYEEATETVAQEREDESAAFKKLVAELKRISENQARELENGLMDVALAIAGRVLDVELDRSDEAFEGIVKEAVSMMRSENIQGLRISKGDYEHFFGEDGSMLADDLESAGIPVRPDPSLKKGDCLLVTDFGTVNTGVSTQLKHIAEGLEEA